MRETYKKAILKRRTARPGVVQQRPASLARSMKYFLIITLARPLHMLFTEPIVGFFSLYSAFTSAVLFGFLTAFPFVFKEIYDFDTSQSGLVFLAVGLGVLVAGMTNLAFGRMYQKRSRLAGSTHALPEHRLHSAMVGSVAIPVGLFWFAWTARDSVHWSCPVLATIPFAWGNLSIFVSAIRIFWSDPMLG